MVDVQNRRFYLIGDQTTTKEKIPFGFVDHALQLQNFGTEKKAEHEFILFEEATEREKDVSLETFRRRRATHRETFV